MATGQWPTIADVASRTDPTGKAMAIAEMMAQSIVIADDAPSIPSNEMGGTSFAYRTSIPSGYFRQANAGVPFGKSTTGKSTVGMASLVGWSQVDKKVAKDTGDPEGFRNGEEAAFMEGMGQTFEGTVWYGNTATNPLQCEGLSYFYNTVNTASAANAANVIDCLGTGNNNLSLWLIGWSPRTIHLSYPRGGTAGLYTEDRGDVVPAFDALGNPFLAWTQYFEHNFGVVPANWQYGVRAANIDWTSAGLNGPNACDLFATMADMVLLPPMLSKMASGITKTDAPTDPATGTRFCFYTCRTGRHWMDVQAMRNRNTLITLNDYDGRVCDLFRQVPVKVSDQLSIYENRLT
jgi:hypothetical protein